jgi:lipopolysaccharide assembly outer membrane protein LptD (OstA)
MKRTGLLRLLAAAALAFAAPRGEAQEAAKPQAPPRKVDVEAGDGMAWQEGDLVAQFLTGLVRMKSPEFELNASRAIVWIRQKSELPLEEIYAEGNVVFKQGTQTLRAERFYYNLRENKALIVDLRGKGQGSTPAQAFFVTAREARMTALGHLEAKEITLSTCPYGVPHYHLEVAEAALSGQDPRPRKAGTLDPFPYERFDLRFEEISPEFGGVPFFFLPGLSLGSWVRDFPLQGVQYGNSSRFGTTVLSDWAVRIRKRDETGKPRAWGQVLGELDWREERGGGYGLDLEYGWRPAGYGGFVDTYFLYDQGRNLDVEFERKFPPLDREERGKAHVFHRQDVHPSWRFELEAYYVSDRSLLEEFFEKEFKELKAPESAAYVRWIDGHWAATVLERHRLNDFQTQDEYVPRVGFHLFEEPLLAAEDYGLYLEHRLDVVQIRRRFDEDLALRDVEAWRFDASTAVSFPFDLGPAQLSPFAEYRFTAFEDDLEGETEARSLWTLGGRIVTQVHATNAGLTWDAGGLRGLRHVVEAEARYANSVYVSMDSSEVFTFEPVDELGEFEELALELRQRFVTRDAAGKPFEFLAISAGIEYYPDSERDTLSARADNREAPFNWIGLAPDGGSFERREWSNLFYDLSFTPKGFLSVRAFGEFNPYSEEEQVRDVRATMRPLEKVTVWGQHTFVSAITDAYTLGAAWDLSPKWSLGGSAQYDFEADEFVRQSLRVSRDFHDFYLEFVAERNFARDDHRFYVTLVPKFLGRSSQAPVPREWGRADASSTHAP